MPTQLSKVSLIAIPGRVFDWLPLIIKLLTYVIVAMLVLTESRVYAVDFYGANVSDKDVPTAAWRYNINGIRPIITKIKKESPSNLAGLTIGDIIVSVNDKKISKATELSEFNDSKLYIYVFSGFTWKTIIIDRTTSSSKPTEVKDTNNVTNANLQYNETNTDTLPVIKFDDSSLYEKYGKESPEEIEIQKKRTRERLIIEEEENKVAKARRYKEEHEWDVIRYEHFNKIASYTIDARGQKQCVIIAPAPYFHEYCNIYFANGIKSRLDCFKSRYDLAEVPGPYVSSMRDKLRKEYCTYRVIGAWTQGNYSCE